MRSDTTNETAPNPSDEISSCSRTPPRAGGVARSEMDSEMDATRAQPLSSAEASDMQA